ncbi:MAG: M28 family peptidase [Gemmatimonadales bacterium]
MKRLAWLLASCTGACGAAGPENQEFDGVAAFSYVERQMEFGPRVPNTSGHQAAGDWIVERLRATADSVEVQQFEHVSANGDTLRLRNFIGRFGPQLSNRILYLAHWDSRPMADRSRNVGAQRQPVPGANDGASGVAVLLGVADVLAANPSNFGVDLLFVDGEDYGDFSADHDVLLGSRYFAANLAEGYSPLFAVLFDMVGDANLEIFQEGYSVNGAPEVVARVWNKAAEIGYGGVFRQGVRHTLTDDHLPLLEAGIRTANVIDFDYPYWHTTDDTIDKISPESLQVVGDVAVALLR